MEAKSKGCGQRRNAFKHGAFSTEIIFTGENLRDFFDLHYGLRDELKPCGTMEEEIVITIAKYLWRRRRIDRLITNEADLIKMCDADEEFRLASAAGMVIEPGMKCSEAWEIIQCLPFFKEVAKRNPLPATEFDDEWIGRIRTAIDGHRTKTMGVGEIIKMDTSYKAQMAAKLRELTAKQMLLEDRLDIMIDKALKRLANLKAFKGIMAADKSRPQRMIDNRYDAIIS